MYVDGGGTATKPLYFSILCLELKSGEKLFHFERVTIESIKHYLPSNCPLTNDRGEGTNNIAEYIALYYGLWSFKRLLGEKSLTIFHDSELVIKQVKGQARCTKPYLNCWLTEIKQIWWPTIEYRWIQGNYIKSVLGH